MRAAVQVQQNLNRMTHAEQDGRAGGLSARNFGKARQAAEVRLTSPAAQAERIIRQVLEECGSQAQLRKQARGERRKVALAARLRAETTVTVAWIAARLAMGTPGYLNNRLYRWRKGLLH